MRISLSKGLAAIADMSKLQQIQFMPREAGAIRPIKTKNYSLIHKCKLSQQATRNSAHSTNIFDQTEDSSLFAINYEENPERFPLNCFRSSKSRANDIKSEHINSKGSDRKGRLFELGKQSFEEIYKSSKSKTERFATVSHLQTGSKKKLILPDGCRLQHSFNSHNSSVSIVPPINRLENNTDVFLYQKGFLSEISYNKNLQARCGNRYFEYLVRDRHKQEMRASPFVYSIRKEVHPSKFVRRARQFYPQILLRNRMKVQGKKVKERCHTEDPHSS